MSNIALFSNGSNTLPAHLQEPDELTTLLAGSGGGRSISIKGGVWRMIVGGEEVAKNEDRAMNLIIVGAAKTTHRTFHLEKYEEGANTPPTCWSSDGVTPNAEVPAEGRQCATCAACPQNIAGSGEGESRACRYNRRLAVVLENDIQGNIYRLQLPAKSLFGKADGDKMSLEAYAKFLAGHKVPISGVVTEARFDTTEAVPVVRFRAVRPLTVQEWADVREASAHPDTQSAIDFTFKAAKPAAPVQAPAPQVAAPAVAPAAPRGRRPAAPAQAPAPAPVQRAEVEVEDAQPPQVRAAKPRDVPPPADALPANVAAALAQWDDDEE